MHCGLLQFLLSERVVGETVGTVRSRNLSRFMAKGEAWKEMAEGGIGEQGAEGELTSGEGRA